MMLSKRNTIVTVSQFHCTKCKNVIPLPRCRPRERGHIKDIWCFKCKEETKHVEQREFDHYFKEEEHVLRTDRTTEEIE